MGDEKVYRRRLRQGAKFLGKVPGDYVDLTENQNKAFNDLFEPLEGEATEATEETTDEAKVRIAAVLEGTVDEVKERLVSVDSKSELKQLRKAEVKGMNRSGVLEAIKARVEEL